MQRLWLILSLMSFIVAARADDVARSLEVVLEPKGPLGIETDDKRLTIRIPDSVRDAIDARWIGFRTIAQEDVPEIQKYWANYAAQEATNTPSAALRYPFVLSQDVTGDGVREVFLPVRHRSDACRWKIIAVHAVKGRLKLYEVDSDNNGKRGPCPEEKPWYGFEIGAYANTVSVTYVPDSCFVANFTWKRDRGYVTQAPE